DQLPHDAHDHRAYCYNEQSWQNTEKDRKYELDAQLGGLLFGHLTGLHAHIVGVTAQAGRDSGAEPVSLNQHGDKFLDVFRTAPVGEVAQRLGAALARFQLEVDQRELFTNLRMGVFQLAGDLGDALIETQSGLHADNQQVESVGKTALQGFLTPIGRQPDVLVRAEEPDRGCHDDGHNLTSR